MGWNYLQKPPLGWPIDTENPLARGLVGCWLMNEGSGDKIYDLSGNGNTGTFVNAASWTPAKYGPGVLFDSTNERIDITSSPELIFETDDFTIIVWAKVNSFLAGVAMTMISIGDTGAGEWMLRLDAANHYLDFYAELGAISAEGGDAWGVGEWHQAVAIRKGSTLSLYRDCIWGAEDTSASTDLDSTKSLQIGTGDSLTTRAFDGEIDHVMIFNRALTASEIRQLYLEPFCMFRDPNELAILGSYEAASGLSIPVAMNNYRQIGAA